MNIKQAKEQIQNAVKAYFTKDRFGNYMIPIERQRLIFLMGPPGIGKTAIMEQIASELGVGLVSYSMTHHTRQSALGLPFIEKKMYGGQDPTNRMSQVGLDLDVIDHYNGTTRPINSLSGGESFKASLALALGLSDEIQSSAGGVRLDTMFVDEGFGSLDDDSLRLAISTLQELTDGNRLVGIISHVGELKTKIDKQIVVTKALSGESSCEIVLS